MVTIDFNRKVDNNDDDGEPQKEKDYHHDMKVKAENQELLAKIERIKLEGSVAKFENQTRPL